MIHKCTVWMTLCCCNRLDSCQTPTILFLSLACVVFFFANLAWMSYIMLNKLVECLPSFCFKHAAMEQQQRPCWSFVPTRPSVVGTAKSLFFSSEPVHNDVQGPCLGFFCVCVIVRAFYTHIHLKKKKERKTTKKGRLLPKVAVASCSMLH